MGYCNSLMTLHFINYIGWLVIPGKAVGCCGVLIIYTWSDGGDSNYQYYTFFSAAVADRRLFDSLSRSSSQKILKKVYLVSVSYDWFSLLNEITFDVRDEYMFNNATVLLSTLWVFLISLYCRTKLFICKIIAKGF